MRPLSKLCKIYAVGLAGAGLILLSYLIFTDHLAVWSQILLFGLLAAVAENFSVNLPRVGAVSVSFIIFFAALILFGPAPAAIVTLFTAVIWKDIKEKSSVYRILGNAGEGLISVGLAGLVYQATGGPLLYWQQRGFTAADFPAVLLPLALAAAVFFISNTSISSLSIGLSEQVSPVRVWFVNCRWGVSNYFALAPLGVALAEIYARTGAVGIFLLAIPLLVGRQTFHAYMGLRKAYTSTIKSLIAAVEAKDPYTRGHSERVAGYAEKIARHLRFSESKIETLRFAALLHDIGKIGISKKILNKTEKLSSAEFAKIKEHPEVGASIIKKIGFLRDTLPAVSYHHEHFNGRGYAGGLSGDDIPMMARILAVADSFDAMTSVRPYRPALSTEEAVSELTRCKGTQFDERMVDTLLACLGLEPSAPQIRKEKGGQLPLAHST